MCIRDSSLVGWTMYDVNDVLIGEVGDDFSIEKYPQLPLMIDDTPSDFSKQKKLAETMNSRELSEYIKEQKKQGSVVTPYLVQLAAKKSFPLITVIAVLISVPFGLISARSGNLTKSFIIGASLTLGFYLVHALSTALGNAELLPIGIAAWSSIVIMGLLGLYFMLGAEYK